MYPLVLAFHKIIPDEYIHHPYFWSALCTPYSHFISLIESLYEENFAFIHLHELEYAKMNPKERTVLLTFDDGYYNNIVFAYPFLKSENIPFVLALNGKCIKTHSWQWFDLVWYHGIQKNQPRTQIIAQIDMFKYNVNNLENWTSSHTNTLQSEIERIFFDIASIEELKSLENAYFVSHTYSHYILTALPEEKLKKEISQNIHFFQENNLNLDNKYFILPNGTKKDFNTRVIDILLETGVEYIFSMMPYIRDTQVIARYTPIQSTWEKEKTRYIKQRFLYKWFKRIF